MVNQIGTEAPSIKPWELSDKEKSAAPKVVRQTFKMRDIAGGKLKDLSTEQKTANLRLHTELDHDRSRTNHIAVFALDFEGVNDVSDDIVQNILVPALGLVKPIAHSTFAYFDNLPGGAAVKISSALARRETLVAARNVGQEDFSLIGDPLVVASLTPAWHALHDEGSWVKGRQFVDVAGQNKVSGSALEEMARLGVALRGTTALKQPIYRSVV